MLVIPICGVPQWQHIIRKFKPPCDCGVGQSTMCEPAQMVPWVIWVIVVAKHAKRIVYPMLVHWFARVGVQRCIRARCNDRTVSRLISFVFQTLCSRHDGRTLGTRQHALRPTFLSIVFPQKLIWIAVDLFKEFLNSCIRRVVAFGFASPCFSHSAGEKSVRTMRTLSMIHPHLSQRPCLSLLPPAQPAFRTFQPRPP